MVIPRLQMSDLTLYPFWFSSGLILSGCGQRRRWLRSRDGPSALPAPGVGLSGWQPSAPEPNHHPALLLVLGPAGSPSSPVRAGTEMGHQGLGWWS